MIGMAQELLRERMPPMRSTVQYVIAVSLFLLAPALLLANMANGSSSLGDAIELHEPTALALLGMGGTAIGIVYLSFRPSRRTP